MVNTKGKANKYRSWVFQKEAFPGRAIQATSATHTRQPSTDPLPEIPGSPPIRFHRNPADKPATTRSTYTWLARVESSA
jgi:hypothetical protein